MEQNKSPERYTYIWSVGFQQKCKGNFNGERTVFLFPTYGAGPYPYIKKCKTILISQDTQKLYLNRS